MISPSFDQLQTEVLACQRCESVLPGPPNPIVQIHPDARLLIAGQAPGQVADRAGQPFADASGRRLRAWLGLTEAQFYDATRIAIVPMGFCFPGRGKQGDLPPRPECAAAWRDRLLAALPNIESTVVIGQYAMDWHCRSVPGNVTARCRAWQSSWPHTIPLPHPSPRNNRWLRRNPWFEASVLPTLRVRVAELMRS